MPTNRDQARLGNDNDIQYGKMSLKVVHVFTIQKLESFCQSPVSRTNSLSII